MILIGTRCELEQVVTDELTAAQVGSGALPVFGTPYMAAMMECAALTCLQHFLEEGQGSVGTHLDISHEAPTPVGMKVTATAHLREIERRKMWFDIEVNDEKGKCGEGSHLRVKITPKTIAAKTEQ